MNRAYLAKFLLGIAIAHLVSLCPRVALGQDEPYSFKLFWLAAGATQTHSVAWGDVDGDGDLDLAAGNYQATNLLYRNEGGVLTAEEIRSPLETHDTWSVAWGDVDRDGDLDLAIGNYGQPNQIYINAGGVLTTGNVYPFTTAYNTTSVAWGDMDGDGHLELAVGNDGQPNQIYGIDFNDFGSVLTATEIYSSTEADNTKSVAWGDVDSDGHLDLAVGNYGQPNRIYRNDGGMLTASAVYSSIVTDNTWSVAWGDVDGDGDLDLAAGNVDVPNRLYRNDSRVLSASPVSTSTETKANKTWSVAWGDMDGDGHLELAVGNDGQPNQIYSIDLNDVGSVLTATEIYSSTETDYAKSVAWGDANGDGDLDLAVGNYGQPNQIYINAGGVLTTGNVYPFNTAYNTTSVAWGDMDGDGHLELAVGNDGQPNQIYGIDFNDFGSVLTATEIYSSTEADNTWSVAWGDVDSDGDLDLAVGNRGQPNRIYRNDGGMLTANAVYSSTETDDTRSVAWGDVDHDGDLDLAAGNFGQPNRIYRNDDGVVTAEAVWSSTEADKTTSVAWGDVNGDGDLDLAAGNYGVHGQPNRIYRNDGGVLTTEAVWSSAEADKTTSVAWGDVDGDGDLDLAAGNVDVPNRLYRNNRSSLALRGATPIAKLWLPAGYDGADFYAAARVWSTPTLPITFTLFHPQKNPAREVKGYYSLDGGDHWLTATSTYTKVEDLASSPYPTVTLANTHVYTWDIAADGVMGQSDNVVFRLEVYPSLAPITNSIPGPFLHGFYATTTLPFRLRGTQVRVVNTASHGLSQAVVYRLPGSQERNARPYADRAGWLYQTNGQGYLQGRGEVKTHDALAALYPVSPTEWLSFTQSVDFYNTSAAPMTQTLAMQEVVTPSVEALNSVQVLTVTSDNKLLVINLDVALEWDARKDVQFMETLKFNLQRTSDLLFDWTNGQAALGQVRIFQDAKRYPAGGINPWEESHIRIYASNRVRPNAAVGGIISPTLVLTEKVTITGQLKEIEYDAGQVHMGAIWNRYGETSGNLGDDWARALAHELGHYVFFLEDNYLGLDENGLLVTVKADGVDGCPGVMNDPYRDDQSEFHPENGWNTPGCQKTLSRYSADRSDWRTIDQFYHLISPTVPISLTNVGPAMMPLAVTQLQEFSPTEAVDTLDVPIFTLLRGEGEGSGTYLRSANAQAFLFQGEWLTDLGQPTLDQLQAWGARPGDRLCLFEPGLGYYGCEQVQSGAAQLVVEKQQVWQPEIVVSSVNSYTTAISGTVPLEAGSQLCGRLYPVDEPAQPGEPVASAAGAYAHTFAATTTPTLEGYVHVWTAAAGSSCATEPSDAASLETVTSYAVGGNPIHRRARRTFSRGGGVHRRARRVPVISADGQVMIYGDGLDATNDEEEWSFTLQAIPTVTGLPPGRTLVGQAYRLTASGSITVSDKLTGTSISFGYLGEQVPPGEEGFLRIYFWQEDTDVCQRLAQPAPCWQPLDTFRDTEYNVASAKTQGVGLYALMAGLEIPLTGPGWNNFAYPISYSQTVSSALASIDGYYTVIFDYRPDQPRDQWDVYSPTTPEWANDLQNLEFGRGYWIYVSSPITLYMSTGEVTQIPSLPGDPADNGILRAAPSAYYGVLTKHHDYSPDRDQVLTAQIDNRVCGETRTKQDGNNIVFMIKVAADDGSRYSGCGRRGRFVTIKAGDHILFTVPWEDNRHVTRITSP